MKSRQAPKAASTQIAWPGARTQRVIAYMTGGMLAASVILGGGPGVGQVVLQAISVFLLCAALNELIRSRSIRQFRWPLVFAAMIASLPVAQLIPLPPALWKLLPGRDVVSET
jgi:uncharacterized membrane protein YoaK (UPF0700 family)